MSDQFSFKEKLKLLTVRHRNKALPHSIIALVVLSVPFFGHHWFLSEPVPENTRPDNVEYRMSMVGDMMMGRHVHEAAIRSNEPIDRVFDYVQPFLDESDYVTGNFETPIMDSQNNEVQAAMEDAELVNKFIHLHSEPWAVDALVNAGFDSVSFANNHTMDYGDLSLQQTLEHLRNAPLTTVGIGDAMNLSQEEIDAGARDAADMAYFDINEDVRAGIIGFTDVFVQGFSAQDYTGGVFTRQNQGITELRNRLIEAKTPEEEGGGGADMVVVHMHWGDEYQVGSNDRQEELAQYLTNYGADVIIGHHSHVLEPVEVFTGSSGNQSIVLNGMGNFVFDQGWSRTKESAMAQLDFLEDGSKQLSFVPLYINDTKPRETSGLAKPYRDFKIFRTLSKELENDWYTKEDGRLIIDLDAAGVLEGVGETS